MNDVTDNLVTISAEIAHEQRRLAELDVKRLQIRTRLEALKSRRHEINNSRWDTRDRVYDTTSTAPSQATPITPRAKLALFRSLFRGRVDVFPLKFVNKNTGKAGYAPECANKFIPGVCGLPRIKCSECNNQAFRFVDDRQILDHLQGRHVMGVYPLLTDETCWFLAVDFDKASWREDVSAFRQACNTTGVPCAVERSQSGNGAHAWLFFQTPVLAKVARQVGSYLLTKAMSLRHQLSMTSYDRLFPSQDTLPRGGFGNLIALPLQYEARQQGNTLFLDENLEPYPDQWRYLACLPGLPASTIESIATEAERQHQVLGVQPPDLEDDNDKQPPWLCPPSGRHDPAPISESLPAAVRTILAQKLFIETNNLPSSLINRIKRLAAFQNPEFHKKQRLRLSTALTPRIIARAEDCEQHIALPRGCLSDLRTLLRQCSVELDLDDKRYTGEVLDLAFQGDLTTLQQQAANALLREDNGILVAPPGFGKTVLGAYLVAKRRCNTLVLVHRRPLMEQWVAQLSLFLGIEDKTIGRLGAGKKRPNGRLDVATIQSLVRKGRVADRVAEYGQVIVDECHHVLAFSFEQVLSEVKGRYVTGLTATPRRRDGHHPIMTMQLGPPLFTVNACAQVTDQSFIYLLRAHETDFRLPDGGQNTDIQAIYSTLATDEARNTLILNDVIAALEAGRNPLVLTERKDHLAFLADHLSGFVRHLVVCHGGLGTQQQKQLNQRLATIPDDEERLILATGRYIGEGFDDQRLDTLFLTMPVAWKGTVTQYAGRLHRLGDKRDVQIHDYVDRDVPVLARMFDKRLRGYRAMGYTLVNGRGDADTTKKKQMTLDGLDVDYPARRQD